MEGKPAIYLGRIVSKEDFRVFIYSPEGTQKLVESWNEYEASMQSGLWFATREEAQSSILEKEIEEQKKRTRINKPKKIEEEAVIEVKDDFLPKD